MADEDEREIDTPAADPTPDPTPDPALDIDAHRVETPEEDEQLAASQRKIDEAKVVAADLAETTPDPTPDSEPPRGSTPGS